MQGLFAGQRQQIAQLKVVDELSKIVDPNDVPANLYLSASMTLQAEIPRRKVDATVASDLRWGIDNYCNLAYSARTLVTSTDLQQRELVMACKFMDIARNIEQVLKEHINTHTVVQNMVSSVSDVCDDRDDTDTDQQRLYLRFNEYAAMADLFHPVHGVRARTQMFLATTTHFFTAMTGAEEYAAKITFPVYRDTVRATMQKVHEIFSGGSYASISVQNARQMFQVWNHIKVPKSREETKKAAKNIYIIIHQIEQAKKNGNTKSCWLNWVKPGSDSEEKGNYYKAHVRETNILASIDVAVNALCYYINVCTDIADGWSLKNVDLMTQLQNNLAQVIMSTKLSDVNEDTYRELVLRVAWADLHAWREKYNEGCNRAFMGGFAGCAAGCASGGQLCVAEDCVNTRAQVNFLLAKGEYIEADPGTLLQKIKGVARIAYGYYLESDEQRI